LIGMGAILSIRSEIGDGSVVAEGAVVKFNQVIDRLIMVAGNPVRKIRDIKQKDREWWEYSKKLYVNLAHKYIKLGMEKVRA